MCDRSVCIDKVSGREAEWQSGGVASGGGDSRNEILAVKSIAFDRDMTE